MPPKPAARSSAGPETVTVRRGRWAAARLIRPANHAGDFSPLGQFVRSRARLVASAVTCATASSSAYPSGSATSTVTWRSFGAPAGSSATSRNR